MENNNYNLIEHSKGVKPLVLHLKYLFVIALVCVVPYIWLIPSVPELYLLISGAVELMLLLIIAIVHIRNMSRRSNDTMTEKDKLPMVIVIAINPLIGIFLYYAFLRKKRPKIARASLIIGVQVFVQYLLYLLLLGILLITLRAGVVNAWSTEDANAFKKYITTIESDTETIFKNSKAGNVEKTRAACVQLGADVDKGNTLPAHPDKTIQDELTKGLTEMKNASTDCLNGVDSNDSAAADRSTDEILDGYKYLNNAIIAMKEN